MEIQVAIIILLVAVIIAALAIFLLATILQLFKINAGLSVVIPLVGQIVAKTNPVNPVVDDINAQLVVARDALEGLMWKKAGPDSAGLVESLFPGEGANFLRRTNRSGKVVNVGVVYTRGVGILAGLGRGAPIGAAHTKGAAVRDAKYQTTEVAKLYPAPPDRRDPTRNIPKAPVIGRDPVHSPYEPALTPGARSRDATGQKIEAVAPAPVGGGAAAPAPSAPAGPTQPAAPIPPGRMSAKGTRPWERLASPSASPPPPSPPPPPPPPAPTGGSEEAAPPPPPPSEPVEPPQQPAAPSTPGRTSVRSTRPWER